MIQQRIINMWNNNSLKSYLRVLILFSVIATMFVKNVCAQAEMEPWGNITGIRKHGQLFGFESSIKVISQNGKRIVSTGLEKQSPHFKRDGNSQIVNTNIDSLFIKETVKDLCFGGIRVTINLAAHKDTAIKGVYFCLSLPAEEYGNGQLRLRGASGNSKDFVPVGNNYEDIAKGIDFKAVSQSLNVRFDERAQVEIKKDTSRGKNDIQVWIALTLNEVHRGDTLQREFVIKSSGDIDRTPANITLNTVKQGRNLMGSAEISGCKMLKQTRRLLIIA